MKIIPSVTLVGRGKDGEKVEMPPGVSTDLPEANAQDLIARGFAVADTAPSMPPSVDPVAGLLDGTIPEIAAKLAELSLDELHQLGELEAGGKARKGVLAVIKEAIADLTPDDDADDDGGADDETGDETGDE